MLRSQRLKFIKFLNEVTDYEYEFDTMEDFKRELFDGTLGGEQLDKLEFVVDLLDEFFYMEGTSYDE